MALTKFTTSTAVHQGLADRPTQTASELKVLFDKSATDIASYLNDTLTEELEAATGASQIGFAPPSGMTAATVQAGIVENKSAHDAFVSGGNFLGTWQGYSPTQTDPGIQGVVDSHSDQFESFFLNAKFLPPELESFTCSGDETDKFVALRSYISSHLPCTVYFPEGTYQFTDMQNWGFSNLSIIGAGHDKTILKCISSATNNTGLFLWAFEDGEPTTPFIHNLTLRDICVEGNSKTLYGIRAYGVSRSTWRNVRVKNCDSSNGTAFKFNACSINMFDNLMCSTDYDTDMSSVPFYGITISTGTRAGVGLGRSTNNVFNSAVIEGMPIGAYLENADQCMFAGGTFESNTSCGCIISDQSRFNSFIGVGFESDDATADVSDSGTYTQYSNCYSSNEIILQGLGCNIHGGLYETITIQSGAVKNCIDGITISYFGGAGCGFFDSGVATEWKNIYDGQLAAYIYPLKDRTAITVGASPFTWQNTTGQYVEVVVQSGSISLVQQTRGSDTFLVQATVPNKILVAPEESLTFTYSLLPSISYLPHNGFQG